jgi:hypothetical protein
MTKSNTDGNTDGNTHITKEIVSLTVCILILCYKLLFLLALALNTTPCDLLKFICELLTMY